MIVTVKSSKPSVVMFEAMKFGVEAEAFVDGTVNLSVQDLDRAKNVIKPANGQIVSIVDMAHM